MLIYKRFRPQDVENHPSPVRRETCPVSPEATKRAFADCADLQTRYVAAGGDGAPLFVCWLDGTVSGADAAEQVIRPLTDPVRFGGAGTAAQAAELLDRGLAYGLSMRRTRSMEELTQAVAYGSCAVVLPGTAFLFELKTGERRTVQEPTIEKTVKGSKDAFVESLRVNTTLVRSRLRTPKLKLRQATVGQESRTDAAVLWLEGVAAPELPDRLMRRLESLELNGLILPDALDSGLCDAPLSPFPQLIHTERPDKLAAALLDGRVGLIADGIPVAFIAPATLPDLLKTNEDGAQHFLAASCIRLLRWAALFLTLLLPASYIAISMYHAEMIPAELLLSVISSKQSVPFSTTAEILGMLVAFELLQEAGLRLPDPVGQTVSIIGALIVGQSAVEAKVISPIAVIVVALAGIAGYTMPSQDLAAAVRLCRFAMALAAAAAGMFGIASACALILWHLCSIESFGRAYIPTSRVAPWREMPRRARWRRG